MRKALPITLVEYEAGDHVGELLALVSLSPIFLVVALAVAVLIRRELYALVSLETVKEMRGGYL